jgi:RNA polymerase sigma factor (sigma-70 family)
MNNTKIILQLQGGNQERAFTRLYKYFPKVEKHILINSGSKEEALDIFQDGLIVLFKKVQDLPADSPIKVDGFLINTCKLLWSNELRKKKVRKNSGEKGLSEVESKQFTQEHQDEIELLIEKEAKFKTIDQVLIKLGEKCKNMLEAFYYKNFSMDKIAKKFGYKTVQSAKTKKYKCMEHARKLASSSQFSGEANSDLNLKK